MIASDWEGDSSDTDRWEYGCLSVSGPCLVSAVVERSVAGEPRSFYHLIVLDDSGGELFVPVDKVQAIGIRPLSQRSDIPKLQGHLMKKTRVAKDWKQRANDILRLFTSGSAFDLAEIVGSLTELSKTKKLSIRESWTLVRARSSWFARSLK